MIHLCFCIWNGDRDWDNIERNIEYVNKLYRGVTRNLSLDHEFICFADEQNYNMLINNIDSKIDLSLLESKSWKGCLPKLKPFDRNNRFYGRVITMDLDCIIVESLDDMFSYTGDLATRRKFNGEKVSGGDMIGFPGGYHSWIWDWLQETPGQVEAETHGSERFIYRNHFSSLDFWNDLYPGQLISYKRHVKKNNEILPKNCRIVSCHNNPRPHELQTKNSKLVERYWK